MAMAEQKPVHKTFRGLMERAWTEEHGWLVSFDGARFYRSPEMPRLGNVEEMERHIADKQFSLLRRYFGYHDVEVMTVVSARRVK